MMALNTTDELTDDELTGIASAVMRGETDRYEWRGIMITRRGNDLMVVALSNGRAAGGRWHVGGNGAPLKGVAAWLRAKADLYGEGDR